MRKLYKFNKPERYEKIVPDYESRDDIKVAVRIYNSIILLNGVKWRSHSVKNKHI